MRILQSGDDFSMIIALDILQHHEAIIRCDTEEEGMDKAVLDLVQSLDKEEYCGPRWLLLHEIEMHDLLSGTTYVPISRTPFFEKLKSLKISFYER